MVFRLGRIFLLAAFARPNYEKNVELQVEEEDQSMLSLLSGSCLFFICFRG